MTKNELMLRVLAKKETRVAYFEHDFFGRCLYHFRSSFHYPKSAPFQREWCFSVSKGFNIYCEAFREAAKTSLIGMMYDIWCICYKKRRFICCFSYEGRSSSEYLFKIAVQLQTNRTIIEDYGQLFYGTNEEKKSQKKSVNEFVTENDVKLKAFSMGSSMRGQIFMSRDGMIRPDSVIFDDIDVLDSVRNPAMIEKNTRFIEDEVLGGLASYCQIRILGNVILEDGLNPRLKRKFSGNDKRHIYSQPIYNEDGSIAWERFVETNAEADEYNKDITDPKKKKISLEQKLRDLGQTSYNQNFLLIPESGDEKLIKRSYIKMFNEDLPYQYIEAGVDPAFSEKTKSDEFSITVAGFIERDTHIDKYILENVSLIGEEKNNNNILKTIGSLHDQYKVRNRKVEKNNGGEIYARMMQDPNLMGGRSLPVTTYAAVKDKYTRLKEHEGAMQRGEVYFKENKCDLLIDQLLIFDGDPKRKDDRVDSFVYAITDVGAGFYFDVF